jgi:hypothetical protein
MPADYDHNLISDIDLQQSLLSDAELAALDERLAGLARSSRPAPAFVQRLNRQVFAASVGQLVRPAVATPTLVHAWPRRGGVLVAARSGRFALAASILLAFTMAMPFQIAPRSTGFVAMTPISVEHSASEAVLVALLQESRPQSASSADVAGSPQASPVLTTRSASYDDFAAEMEALLNDGSGSAL